MSDKLNIEITYTWTISKKEWIELKDHLSDLEKREFIKGKIEWDGVSAFFNLRNIQVPTISNVKVNFV